MHITCTCVSKCICWRNLNTFYRQTYYFLETHSIYVRNMLNLMLKQNKIDMYCFNGTNVQYLIYFWYILHIWIIRHSGYLKHSDVYCIMPFPNWHLLSRKKDHAFPNFQCQNTPMDILLYSTQPPFIYSKNSSFGGSFMAIFCNIWNNILITNNERYEMLSSS